MEIRQLYYVLATAKHKNFTKAAEELFTSQPNISKQIGLLEEELDTKLFFRSHHSVILTRDGERFCMHAQKVVDDLESLQRDFDRGAQEKKIRLNIAVCPFFDRLEMAPALRSFFKQSPDVLGSVRVADNYESYRALDSGDMDFAILKLRPVDMLNQFRYRLLVSEKLVVMISETHELASRETLSTEDLGLHDFATEENFTSLYTENSVHRIYSSADFLMEMMSEVGGLTFITESSAATVTEPGVKMIPLEPPIEYCTYLIYPRDRKNSGTYKEFIDYAMANMAQ